MIRRYTDIDRYIMDDKLEIILDKTNKIMPVYLDKANTNLNKLNKNIYHKNEKANLSAFENILDETINNKKGRKMQ